jgi:hypothetical protein
MALRRFVVFLIATACFTASAFPAQRKKQEKEPVTQKLEVPKDPPAVAIGDSSRLVFHVSPLSGKGLLSPQTRDALKAILKENGGTQILHIRAFVAGSGDVRRIPQIVSEVFADKKLPLPSVSVILAGGLPLEGAQVVIESISEAKKAVSPEGITFIAGQDSVDKLATAAGSATMLQVSCFVTDLSDAGTLTAAITERLSDFLRLLSIWCRRRGIRDGLVRNAREWLAAVNPRGLRSLARGLRLAARNRMSSWLLRGSIKI